MDSNEDLDVSIKDTNLSLSKEELLKKWLATKNLLKPTISHTDRDLLFLSCSQQRIWFFEELFPNTPVYNVYSAIELRGNVRVDILEQAIQSIIRRHQSLQTYFTLQSDQPIQRIKPNASLALDYLDLRISSLSEETIENMLIEKAREVFDLKQAPLLRAYFFQITDQRGILLIVGHHLIFDGWSLGIFFRELSLFYNARLDGKGCELKPLPIDYLDYVAWQHNYLETPKIAQQIKFWEQQLIQHHLLLKLPVDRPYPLIPSFKGKRKYFNIQENLTTRIKTLAQSQAVTPFMLLLSGLYTLMFRYTLSRDMIIGIPIANRKHEQLEGLLGFFANTLAVRLHFPEASDFATLLQHVKTATMNAYEHQDSPLEKIVQKIQPKRNLNTSPLFNLAFVFHNTPTTLPNLKHINAKLLPLHNQTSKFDLLLTMVEHQNQLHCAFEYNVDIFNESTIDQLAEHYVLLLEEIVKNPNQELDRYPLVNSQAQKTLLQDMECSKQFNVVDTLGSLLTQQVRLHPDAVALVWRNHSLSYRQLDERSNQLANYLLYQGVRSQDCVGLTLEVGFELVISAIALLKIGAVYVPIDPLCPEQRFKFILEDAKLRYCLTQALWRHKITDDSISVIVIDQVDLSQQPQSLKDLAHDARQLAYIIYTSGSTGLPKGVTIEHGQVIRLFLATQAWFQFSASDIWCLFHSFAFDFSVWELWGALLHGGKLVLVDEEVRKSTEDFYHLLIKQQITVLNQTPSAFYALSEVDQRYAPAQLSALRWVIFGGEVLNLSRLKIWFDRHGDSQPVLVNMYGITETTVHVSYRPLKASDLTQFTSPLGEPIPDLEIYLLDRHLQLVPKGAVGEIYVGGAGVTRGYLNRPELNQERFICNPFKNNPSRLYKTGDLARYVQNTELEYINRSDQQIKLRGFRIELKEIEYHLRRHELVKDCVMVLDTLGHELEKQLIAYVILQPRQLSSFHDNNAQKEGVHEWEMVFNECYRGSQTVEDPKFNITGWLNSYTREPLSNLEMREWVMQTVKRLLALKHEQVLEIGCGTGLLLGRIAPDSKVYDALDISQVALDYIDQHLMHGADNLNHVKLYLQTAEDLQRFTDQSYQLAILNSVCQYFPSLEYLFIVIKNAVAKIKDHGCLFIGDVRNLTLASEFYTRLVASKNLSTIEPNEIECLISMQAKQDGELLVHPDFFRYLMNFIPRITHFEILLKQGNYHNELNCFRYDVILYIQYPKQAQEFRVKDCHQEMLTQTDLNNLIATQTDTIIVKNIANKRLQAIDSIDPQDLFHAAEQHGKLIKVLVSESKNPFVFDFILNSATISPGANSVNIQDLSLKDFLSDPHYANSPLSAKQYAAIPRILRDHLIQFLPEYMLPNWFVPIDKIPLTINGKCNYAALPKPLPVKLYDNNYQPPKTATELKVANAFSEMLQISSVGRTDNFFHLGGHSLLATRLVYHLQSVFNIKIPLRLILLKASVFELAEAIDKLLNQTPFAEIEKFSLLDLNSDIKLDDTIYVNHSLVVTNRSKNVLLTGATGFVGAFLLHELLQQPHVTVYCLIRSENLTLAWDKLKHTLQQYLLWSDALRPRIKIVLGDLAKPELGMNYEAFQQLSTIIDQIYHNGACVNFIYSYDTLKASNVLSCGEILKLAATTRVKPVEFISTLFVFSEEDHKDYPVFTENSLPKNGPLLKLGYTQSKWVAEQIMLLARGRNIPVNIYRLGRIGSHHSTGACQTNDFLWELVRMGIHSGHLPFLNQVDIDLSPVDYVAKAIVKLSQMPTRNQNYHLLNTLTYPFNLLVSQLVEYGYPIKQEEFTIWQQKLLNAPTAFQSILERLLPVISQMQTQNQELKFDNVITRSLLAKHGIMFPAVKSLIIPTINYFERTGYFSFKIQQPGELKI